MASSIGLVAATNIHGVIGIGGKLPWPSHKEDLRIFYSILGEKTLVVGEKTYKEMPKNRGIKYKIHHRGDTIPEGSIIGGGQELFRFALSNKIPDFVVLNYIHSANNIEVGDKYFPLGELISNYDFMYSVASYSGDVISNTFIRRGN